jgi:hypothetical protein
MVERTASANELVRAIGGFPPCHFVQFSQPGPLKGIVAVFHRQGSFNLDHQECRFVSAAQWSFMGFRP